MAHHKVKNGELVRAGRIQVMVDNFYSRNEPMILRVLDATTRFFVKVRAKPILGLLSRLLGFVLPTGEVVTAERAIDFIDAISVLDKTEIAVGPCMCQKALGKRNGTYIKDMVILYGAEAYKMAYPEYKDLSPEEAKELLRKFHKEGLMPTFYSCLRSGGWIYAICNCEGKICFPFRAHQAAGAVMYPGPNIVAVDKDNCIGCGMCVERCHFGANALTNEICKVDLAKCYGRGICIPTCNGQARRMVEREGYHTRYYPIELVAKHLSSI
jgi:NAD-dependent dihydropyrimidine dehydrogenase PreA subunit